MAIFINIFNMNILKKYWYTLDAGKQRHRGDSLLFLFLGN